MLNFMKEKKEAGREFHELIKDLLSDIVLQNNSIDNAFFAWFYKEKHIVIIISEINDFLILTDINEVHSLVSNGIKKAL